ncbi:HesB/YadR/YfhF family protein [Bacillus sp. CGMCC 1.16541]|uniref:HesB/YadR/YfhF family protein n=1 Tax=Bacillus sp. CGMCC 1.16541 TaxID=2185143 RepID=UPI000D727084|nr:HesB/YadR/YfhF family protein [Bacillus sp. CGMCC 1.16541]
MKLTVTEQAANWYKTEMNVTSDQYVRFFARYGGCSNVQKGFSLGVGTDNPINIGAETTVAGITFFIEEEDVWYFDSHDLIVDYNSETKEPDFKYEA